MEQILAFGLNQAEEAALKELLAILPVKITAISDASFTENLETLAQDPALFKTDSASSSPEKLLLFCELTEKHFNTALSRLKSAHFPADYKAVLTPTNRKWNVSRLYAEMSAEKRAIEASFINFSKTS